MAKKDKRRPFFFEELFMKNPDFIVTTIVLHRETYKAAKLMAVHRETSVSAMLRAGLMLYMAEPDRSEKILARENALRIAQILRRTSARKK